MSLIEALHRRLEDLQRSLWFRVIASVAVVATSAYYFGRAAIEGQAFIDRSTVIIEEMIGDQAHVWATDLLETGRAELPGGVVELDPAIVQTLVTPEGEIGDPLELASLMLGPLQPDNVPDWMWKQPSATWGMAGASAATGLLVIWTGLVPLFVLIGGFAVIGAVLLVAAGMNDAALALGSAAALLMMFHGLMRVLVLVLEPLGPGGAVAATVLRESTRSRVALAFVVALLILLPLLPLSLDTTAPLRHQVQALLDRSLSLTFAMVAVMTMTIGCSTIAFDIRDRHIWHLVTKPLGTCRYLLGKWGGVLALNAVLLVVGSTFAAAWTGYLRWSPPPESMDAGRDVSIVANEILTAHAERLPDYPPLTEEEVRSRVEAIIAEDPEYAQFVDTSPPPALVRALRAEVREVHGLDQRRAESVLNQAEDPWETVVFSGLDEAKELGLPLRLRFRMNGGSSDEHQRRLIGIAVNGQLENGRVGAFKPTLRQQIVLSPEAVREDGTVEVTFVNLTHWPVPAGTEWRAANLRAIAEAPPQREPFAILWEPRDVELLYPAGGFMGNYTRCMLVQWVRLAALAAVACISATFLSFPVACLASLTILVGAVLGPFLAIALGFFAPPPFEMVEGIGETIAWGMDSFIRTIASSLVYMLGAFGEFAPVDKVIQGRLVGWGMVWRSMLQLGVFWCLPLLLMGWLILRSRQLAIYSGDS